MGLTLDTRKDGQQIRDPLLRKIPLKAVMASNLMKCGYLISNSVPTQSLQQKEA